jgi:flavin-dependent dehydrogenase
LFFVEMAMIHKNLAVLIASLRRGGIILQEERAAHSGCVERGVGKGWIAVGDALMGWDPLTSSGISGALSDGLAAAPAIIDMLEGGRDGARAYAERANAVFGRYLMERLQRYGAESRWRQSAFWARRTQWPQTQAAGS